MKIKNTKRMAQVIIEFVFCMIIVFLMIYAAIKIFRWTGLDLAERRKDHDALLIVPINRAYGCISYDSYGVCDAPIVPESTGPMKQLDPYFSKPTKMNTIWDGS